MAATVVRSGPFVQLTVIDANWVWTTTFPRHTQGIKVDWIAFKPGATGDKLSIKKDSATGAECFPSIPRANVYDGQISYYDGNLLRPVIDLTAAASVFSSGHEVVIKLKDNSGD